MTRWSVMKSAPQNQSLQIKGTQTKSKAEQAEASMKRGFDATAIGLGGVLALVMLVVLGRVAQLQVAPTAQLKEHIDSRTTSKPVLPVRGDIKDRRDRVLAATRFAWRVVVDPTIFPEPPDTHIVALANLLKLPPEVVGERLLRALVENDRRAEAHGGAAIRTDDKSAAARLARMLNTKVDTIAAAARDNTIMKPLAEPKLDSAMVNGEPVGEVLPFSPEAIAAEEAALQARISGGAGGATSAIGEPALSEPALVEPALVKPKPIPKKPIRYVPMGGVIEDELASRVRALKIPGVALERRQVREYPANAAVASIVGKVDFEHQGLLGTEKMLDKSLKGTSGKVGYVRDSIGRPLWTKPGQVVLPKSGDDVRLTIDLEIQRIASEELLRGIEDADATGGRLVMIDPRTGEVLAMVDIVRDMPELVAYPWADKPVKVRGQPTKQVPSIPTKWQRYVTLTEDKGRKIHPSMARNRCVEDVYEPGSTFKPFVWSSITELKLALPAETFDTEGGRWRTAYGRPIQDVTRRASMTWADVLVNSSNIGMIKAAERMSYQQLRDVPIRFGFGSKTAVGLPGEASGIVTTASKWGKYTQTSVAYGHEIAVTPVQMVRAFSAFARQGELAGTIPQLHLTGATDPETTDLTRGVVVRVLRPETALLTRATMQAVANNMEHRWAKPPEGGWRYSLFGKSGTAEIPLGRAPTGKIAPRGASGYFDDQYNSSFVAGAPIEDPRLAIIVVIDDPGPSRIFSNPKSHYGAAVAGPVVRRTVERTLAYLGVAPSPTSEAMKVELPEEMTRPSRTRRAN